MSTKNFIIDKDILWIEVPKSGTPSTWVPGTNYKLGDTVVPTSTFVLPPGKDGVMFQCVGFVGKSGSSSPTFPASVGNIVVDNNIEWTCRDPNEPSVEIDWFEYYQTEHTLTLT